MKTTITLLFLITLCFACKAQSPILPKYGGDFKKIEGAYYKDTFNDFNGFEGTWQYTNGNTTFKVILQKKEMAQYISPMSGRSYYEDLLIGEYKYVENGVEKVNTLSFLPNNYTNPYEHYIAGGSIQKYNPNVSGICIGCNPGDVQVRLIMFEPDVEIPGVYLYIYLRHYTENGIEKLEAEIIPQGMIVYNKDENPNPTFDEYSIPLRTPLVLTKQ
jgi:hypothetical protein